MSNLAPVTVVIPCHNSSATIARAVVSVLGQTVRPAAVMVVDDASTDDTRDVLRDFEIRHPEWIRCITLGKNRGPSYARNTGWDAATTEYVAFLDADDAWHPRKVEIQTAWLAEHGEAQMCGHKCVLYNSSEPNIQNGNFEIQRFSLRDMLVSNRFSTPSVMVRRLVRHRFPTSRRHAEDYELWLLMAAESGYVDRIELPLAWYFKAPYGESGLSRDLWAMEKGELAALSELRRRGCIGSFAWAAFSAFSLAKYGRRIALSYGKK